jgi:hypothetical protein
MNNLSQALTVLSAMITPAILIMACGSLTMTTSQRLGRIIERTQNIGNRFKELAKDDIDPVIAEEEKRMLYQLLSMAARRAKLLQRSMVCLYLALSIFVATSVAIGIVDVSNSSYVGVPIALGMTGASLLFYASIVLIAESRIALAAVDYEMDFTLSLSRRQLPEKLLQKPVSPRRKRWYRPKN